MSTRWIAAIASMFLLIGLMSKPCWAEANAEEWKKDMVVVPAGEFWMGSPDGEGMKFEQPRHKVELEAFWIDKYEVTNAQFDRFVKETGHLTQAEWLGFGFVMLKDEQRKIDGASWRHPWGPESSIEDKMDHPVVQVGWEDAAAYAAWAEKRLPTEAEWEKAAGGPDGLKYPFSRFYDRSKARIGFPWDAGPIKAGSYAPNGYGIHDMGGNVMEWCADLYLPDYYEKSPSKNPRGPEQAHHRTVRGGSWFYGDPSLTRTASRKYFMDTWNNNIGFRCARDAEQK